VIVVAALFSLIAETQDSFLTSINLSDPAFECETKADGAPICPKPFVLMAPTESKATWDISVSPYAGGEDLLFATRILEKAETYMLSKTQIAYAKTAYARFWRLTELVTIWFPINYFAMVVQHEVFGHGYRLRDLETRDIAEVSGYSFEAPPPYGPGGAATFFLIAPTFTTMESSAVSSAGVESTAILALLTKLKWLASGKIDPRQTVLYLLSEQDLTLYASTLKSQDIDLSGHDLTSYLETLNYTYPEAILTKERLYALSWINLIDPFTFYSIYAWFHYLSSGKESKIPMIGSCYLPGLRLGLTPFGPELFIDNFLVRDKTPLYFYFKWGNHAKNTYFGLGTYVPRFWSVSQWAFGLRFDFWRQPKLLLQQGNVPFEEIDFRLPPNSLDPLYSPQEQHEMISGAAGSLIANFQANSFCGGEIELGYKSQGFLPGYSLFAFPTVRVSFTIDF